MHERRAVSEAIAGFLAVAEARPLQRVVLATRPGMSRDIAAQVWSELTAGTRVSGAMVVWEDAYDTLECFECGERFGGTKLDTCPCCGGDGLVVEKAPECAVRSWVDEEHR